MMTELDKILGSDKLTAEEKIELLTTIAKAVCPEGHEEELDALMKAAGYAAGISCAISDRKPIPHALVRDYNKAIMKAFPEDQEKKKPEECSQDDKSDSEHSSGVKPDYIGAVKIVIGKFPKREAEKEDEG